MNVERERENKIESDLRFQDDRLLFNRQWMMNQRQLLGLHACKHSYIYTYIYLRIRK